MQVVKTCACGATFTGAPQRKKCSNNCGRKKDHNPRRTKKRLDNDIQFIAVDGEGVDRPDGKHEYIMLSVGQDTLANSDGSALHHDQIFTFLYAHFSKNTNAAYIGFFLGYDFDQWIKSFTEQEARILLTKQGVASRKRKRSRTPEPFPVYVGRKWEVDLLGKRRFRLAPHLHERPKGTPGGLEDKSWDHCRCGYHFHVQGELKYGEKDVAWDVFFPKRPHEQKRMYICDTGPFWQQSFMSVVDPRNWPDGSVVSEDEYEILKQGKDSRGIVAEYGDVSYFDEMVTYNRLENKILARVTKNLNEGFMSIGIKVPTKDWYGPGRPAQIWLNGHVRKDEIDGDVISHEAMEKSVPKYAIDAGRCSYYGGWFEQFIHGHINGAVYEYDINSAYPYIISMLPCLVHGTWSRGDGTPEYGDKDLLLLKVTTEGSDPYIGGLPHRSSKGHITHPQNTIGWYWKEEINAAVNAGLIDRYSVSEWVRYIPCDCDPPLADIAGLYGKRIGVGLNLTTSERNKLKNGASGKAYKCVYNSAYGKFAQTVGSPRYGNPIYASLITAGCRTLILTAIATHPEKSKAVTMVATDGVYFTSPHPMVTDAYALGSWDVSVKEGMTQFMPGIYWDDKARTALRQGKALKLKSRGISARDLALSIEAIDGMFTQMQGECEQSDGDVQMAFGWPSLELKVKFALVSCLQAVIRKDWGTAGSVIHDGKRDIDSNPRTKRQWAYAYVDERGNLRTRPYVTGMERGRGKAVPQVQTTYYEKSFGFEVDWEIRNSIGDMGVVMDGDISELFGFFMKGVRG